MTSRDPFERHNNMLSKLFAEIRINRIHTRYSNQEESVKITMNRLISEIDNIDINVKITER